MRVELSKSFEHVGLAHSYELRVQGVPEKMVLPLQMFLSHKLFSLALPENTFVEEPIYKMTREHLIVAVREMATSAWQQPGLGKIPCIKVVRYMTSMGLKDAKDLVEEAQSRYGLWKQA
jgi:hypothetical protein